MASGIQESFAGMNHLQNCLHSDEYMGTTFSGAVAKFLRKQKDGYKLVINPLVPSHTDDIYISYLTHTTWNY